MIKVLVIGPTYIDTTYFVDRLALDCSSKVISKKFYLGGTGLSLAYYLKRLINGVGFVSVIGNDTPSKIIQKELKKNKINARLQVEKNRIDQATVLIDQKGEKICISERKITDKISISKRNLNSLCKEYPAIFITTISGDKILKILEKLKKIGYLGKICLTLNAGNASDSNFLEKIYSENIFYLNLSVKEFNLVKDKQNLLKKTKFTTLTDGANGSYIYEKGNLVGKISLNIINNQKIPNFNGAGEAYAAGVIFSILRGTNPVVSAKFASNFVIKILKNKKNLLRRSLNYETKI